MYHLHCHRACTSLSLSPYCTLSFSLSSLFMSSGYFFRTPSADSTIYPAVCFTSHIKQVVCFASGIVNKASCLLCQTACIMCIASVFPPLFPSILLFLHFIVIRALFSSYGGSAVSLGGLFNFTLDGYTRFGTAVS